MSEDGAASMMSDSAAGGGLPGEGWTAHKSPSGVPYYYNEATKTSVWSLEETVENQAKRPRKESADGDVEAEQDAIQDVTAQHEAEKRKRIEEETVNLLGDSPEASAAPNRASLSSSKKRKSVDVDQAVEELSEERKVLQGLLSSKDAVLDPRCKSWISQWIAEAVSTNNQRKLQRDVDHAIDMLSSGYEGYGEYVGKVLGWIDLVSPVKPGEEKKGNTAAVAHFKSIAQKEFTPDKVASVVSEGSAPPEWLVDMLSSAEWRNLLISLADRHKMVPMLDFSVKAICKAGLHKEVSEVVSTVAYFDVFRRTLTDTMRNILQFDPNATHSADSPLVQLRELEEKFHDIASFSQFTYMFAIETLEALEGSIPDGRQVIAPIPKSTKPASSSSDDGEENPLPSPSPPASIISDVGLTAGNQSKLRRLRQGLEKIPRKPGDTSRLQDAIALCNPINRRSPGGLSAASVSGGSPEFAHVLRSFISERVLRPEAFRFLRSFLDPATNPGAAFVRLWPIRQADFLLLLTQQLFDPYKELEPQARKDGAYILAVASARLPADVNLGLTSMSSESGEVTVYAALEEAMGLCKDKEMFSLEGLQKGGHRIQRLAELVREFPPVSAGLVFFARSLIPSHKFQQESFFTTGVHSLLFLIHVAIEAHPLQRVMAFFTIVQSLRIAPSNVIQHRVLEIKQAMLDELVALMCHGFVFQVLEYVKSQADAGQLDGVLLRHFVLGLARVAGSPFSPGFARAALQLVNLEQVNKAVRASSSKENQRQLGDFKVRLSAAKATAHIPIAPPVPVAPTTPMASQQIMRVVPGTNRNKMPLLLSPNPQRKETIRLVPFQPHK